MKIILSLAVLITIITGTYFYVTNHIEQPGQQAGNTEQPYDNAKTEENEDPKWTTSDLTAKDSVLVIVNKNNSLPIDYVPADLVVPAVRLRLASSHEQMKISKKANSAIEKMFSAAKKDGVTLVFGSGYRSSTLQRQFYNSYVATDGQKVADTYSARPGHSEHQTGLAVDITSPSGTCHLEICWQNTPEGKWVAKNAHKFGFVIRYLLGKEKITGYQYEPWHLRYIGDLAAEVKQSGKTLEEFFGLPAAPNY